MLLYGAIATPLTALAGWLWAKEIERLSGGARGSMLETHQWLGIGLMVGFILLAIWRWRIFAFARKPDTAYLVVAALVVAALMYQGYLGGKMTMGCFWAYRRSSDFQVNEQGAGFSHEKRRLRGAN
jgi:uncharacterized membrane protein